MDAASRAVSPGASPAASGRYAAEIARALATEGGHLAIGRGGFTLHFGRGWLSGHDVEAVKAASVAAGLPVIDSRCVAFEAAWDLAVHGPMVAVGEPPSPPPNHALSYAPLAVVAQAYRAARAEVLNVPRRDAAASRE